MANKTVLYNDFTKGDYGNRSPVETGPLAKTGMWTGTAVAILPDGSLTAAPDPKTVSTSLPALAGAVVDMGMGYKSTGSVIWFKAGNKIYQSGAGPTYTFTAATGTSANTASYIDRVASNTSTYAITSTNVLEVIDHAAGSVAAVAGSPPSCSTVAQYGDRLMLGGSGANANRLYFSAAGNFASWPAGNYIDVGDTSAIVALVPMRGFLAIAKAGGTDDTWWTLRGVPGVNAVLRRASRFHSPPAPNGVALLNDNRAGFAINTFATPGLALGVPAFFDGAAGRLAMEMLDANKLASTQTEAYRMGVGSDVMLRQPGLALMRRGGAWVNHTLPAAVWQNTTNFATTSRSIAVDPSATSFSMMNNAGDTFYKWRPYLVRPVFSADTFGTLNGAATLTLPEWRAATGEEVAVTSVVVAFRKWNTGDGGNANQFGITVTSTDQYPDGVDSGASSSWTEAAASSSSGGTRARHTFSFAPVFGNGFYIGLTILRGVSIESVLAIYETRGVQGTP